MQSIADLPNVQLKSDLLQLIFDQTRIVDTIPCAFVDRFWRNAWKTHLRSRSIVHLDLGPYVQEVDPSTDCKIYIEEGGEVNMPILFEDVSKKALKTRWWNSLKLLFLNVRTGFGPNSGRISILRQFFRMAFTFKKMKLVTLDMRDKSINEQLVEEAIKREFPGKDVNAIRRIPVYRLTVSVDQLFCLRWFDCRVLRITWADVTTSKYLHLIRGIPVILLKTAASSLLNDDFFAVVDSPLCRSPWTLSLENLPIFCEQLSSLIKDFQFNDSVISCWIFDLLGQEIEDEQMVEMAQRVFDLCGSDGKFSLSSYWPEPDVYLAADLTINDHKGAWILPVSFEKKKKEDGSSHVTVYLKRLEANWKEKY